MTNKEASSKQEQMVADFLGWKVVTGSGSRPFSPGDVKNDYYLVECKTHTKEQKNIVFYKRHWIKICTESRSINKYPALVVDNGTQLAICTWVLLPKRVITSEFTNELLNLVNTSNSDNTITFSSYSMYQSYECNYVENAINYFAMWLNEERVAIMPLSEFRKFYQEQFEC